jgi:hypothetical protein
MDLLQDFPQGKRWSIKFSSEKERRDYMRIRRHTSGANLERKAMTEKLSDTQISEAESRIADWLSAPKERPARGEGRPKYPGFVIMWPESKN